MSEETDWLGIIYSFVGRDFAHLGPRHALEAHRQAIEVDHADAIERKDAAIAELVQAGRAVVDRWDSPLWKDLPHTGEFIAKLRAVIAKYDK